MITVHISLVTRGIDQFEATFEVGIVLLDDLAQMLHLGMSPVLAFDRFGDQIGLLVKEAIGRGIGFQESDHE